MRAVLLYSILVFLVFNCKEKSDVRKPKEEETSSKEKVKSPIPSEIIEIGKLGGIVFSNLSDVQKFFTFKQIDENGTVSTIDMNTAVALYSGVMKRGMTSVRPIFELEGTDMAIFPVEGVGFGGAIWANVLVDRKTLRISKIEFKHKAESDGYGAAMTESSFEDKFAGAKIDLKKNTFSLQTNRGKRTDDGIVIDGISGATMTSEAVIEMVNLGLKKYKQYLRS